MALAAMLWVPIAVRKNEHIILTYSLVNFFFTHPLTDAAGPFVARRLGGGAAHLGSFKYDPLFLFQSERGYQSISYRFGIVKCRWRGRLASRS